MESLLFVKKLVEHLKVDWNKFLERASEDKELAQRVLRIYEVVDQLGKEISPLKPHEQFLIMANLARRYILNTSNPELASTLFINFILSERENDGKINYERIKSTAESK